MSLGGLSVCRVEAHPTRCWTGFLEHCVLGPAALPAEQRESSRSCQTQGRGCVALRRPHEILLELPGCPALSEVCGEYGVFFLLAGRCCRVSGFQPPVWWLCCLSLAAEWRGRGGCPAKDQVHSSHTALGRGISGGEPMMSQKIRKQGPAPHLLPFHLRLPGT